MHKYVKTNVKYEKAAQKMTIIHLVTKIQSRIKSVHVNATILVQISDFNRLRLVK